MNMGGNIIHIKSAALLGKPHLFSVPATQLKEPKITNIERKVSYYLNF